VCVCVWEREREREKRKKFVCVMYCDVSGSSSFEEFLRNITWFRHCVPWVLHNWTQSGGTKQCTCWTVLQIEINWSNIHLFLPNISWLVMVTLSIYIDQFISFRVVITAITLLSISILSLSFITRNSSAHYIPRNMLPLHKPTHNILHYDITWISSNYLPNTPDVQFST